MIPKKKLGRKSSTKQGSNASPFSMLGSGTAEQAASEEGKGAEPEHTFGGRVMQASGLASADTFGKADPYVIVYWNRKEVYRTSVISDTLDPVWDNEVFDVTYKGSLPSEATLDFEVW